MWADEVIGPYDIHHSASHPVGAEDHCQVQMVYKMFGDMVYTLHTIICG